MSPQLRFLVYGSEFNAWWDESVSRFGGWRPVVFMQSGLAVGMWMTTASLIGVWLWRNGALPRLRGWSVAWLVPVLVVTTLLCKSLGALVLLVLGLLALWVARGMRSAVVIAAVALLPVAYMLARTAGHWSAGELRSVAAAVSPERASSLETRLDNEVQLVQRALERPAFGWGGWGRNRIYDEETGRDKSITDGAWIIYLGVNGSVGLIALTAVQLLPVLLVGRRCPARMWTAPAMAAPMALAVILVLYATDNLFNAMPNPIYMLIAGGLTSWYATCGPVSTSGRPLGVRAKYSSRSGRRLRAMSGAPMGFGPSVEERQCDERFRVK
jgi:O-antigen ligase